MGQKHAVVVQCWENDVMFDAPTLHINMAARDSFIDKAHKENELLPECDRIVPHGVPYSIEVDLEVFEMVKASGHGIEYPGQIDVYCC